MDEGISDALAPCYTDSSIYFFVGLNINSPARARPPKRIMASGLEKATASESFIPRIFPVYSNASSASLSFFCAARNISFALILFFSKK